MRSVFVRRGAVVCAIWGSLLAVNASFMFAFDATSVYQDHYIYWACGVGFMALTTLAVFIAPVKVPASTAPPHRGGRARNGAAAPAFAVACMLGGMAWVFGIYMVYIAVPLVFFCVARWRVELAERRQRKRLA